MFKLFVRSLTWSRPVHPMLVFGDPLLSPSVVVILYVTQDQPAAARRARKTRALARARLAGRWTADFRADLLALYAGLVGTSRRDRRFFQVAVTVLAAGFAALAALASVIA